MRALLTTALLTAPLLGLGTFAPQGQRSGGFTIQQVAPGIHALIRTEPPGLVRQSNVVVIVNANDVFVVDTTGSPEAAREVIDAIRKITPKPVSHVINTHWHDDHVLGNAAFQAAFPKAMFAGHERFEAQATDAGVTSRNQLLQILPLWTQELRMSLEQSKSRLGGPLTDEERRSHQADIAAAGRYLTEAPNMPVTVPTIRVSSDLTVKRETRTIEILVPGPGHTSEDLVVFLPKEGVMATGDLVVAPIPLLTSASQLAAFPATLKNLTDRQPTILIPGHGPVLKGVAYIDQERRLFEALTAEVRTAAAAGAKPPQIRKTVTLAEYERSFAGDSPLLKMLFDMQVRTAGVSALLRTLPK